MMREDSKPSPYFRSWKPPEERLRVEYQAGLDPLAKQCLKNNLRYRLPNGGKRQPKRQTKGANCG